MVFTPRHDVFLITDYKFRHSAVILEHFFLMSIIQTGKTVKFDIIHVYMLPF